MLYPNEFVYFAYGSNMSVPRLSARIKPIRHIANGQLDGYRLTFDKASKDGSGKCDCKYTGNPEHCVWGVLFAIDNHSLADLDKYEDAGRTYKRVQVSVQTEQGVVSAVTYIATKTEPGLRPYHWYKYHVLYGARAAKLPPDYIAVIERIEQTEDSDAARIEKNLAVYGNVRELSLAPQATS
ncbi:gamma-glutamylcyclotransferase [Paraburkholderia bryophila]|uniref:gamma-glutamylcyclotransferase family protein n=1 Tax=Paraburkholderia bryophila TaxID=420952 RepID=UPI0038BA4A05